MRKNDSKRGFSPAALMILMASCASTARAQVPPEVEAVRFEDPMTLAWDALSEADDYNVYRGLRSDRVAGRELVCHGDEIVDVTFVTQSRPPLGDAYFYLVTGESDSAGEGEAGVGPNGSQRRILAPCDAIVRHHRLNRLGFGWGEWSAAEYDALGPDGYLAAQMDPSNIPEGSELLDRLAPYDPPTNLEDLRRNSSLRAIYSRRQLEQQYTMFFVNHFSTEYYKVREYFFQRGLYDDATVDELTADSIYRDMNKFREIAFNGSFRQILETAGLGSSMLVYLDNYMNTGENPNENYARELMELHSMGADNGYTQTDVEEMARIWSGWSLCKKTFANADDPTAPCIAREFEDTTPGDYVANFRVTRHDCGSKRLFAGTPEQLDVPDTCANPDDGVNDIYMALDAVASHPSAPRFIAGKILGWFVSEDPSEEMIDSVVAVWNDSSNPAGVGDLRAVLEAVVNSAEFRNPDVARNKIKTPLEHIASMLRATRGSTDGDTGVRSHLDRTGHELHLYDDPTGYPERADFWMGTTLLLESQKTGIDYALKLDSAFGNDIIGLLSDNGLDATSPPEDIALFWAEILFGTSLTDNELQEIVDYMTTDDAGQSTSVTNERIRDAVGLMLGFGPFFEQ